MAYSFNVNLLNGRIEIDTARRYGYWERADGSEGGGLWFDTDGKTLCDYDGAEVLPLKIIAALRDAGYILNEDYN